jgi:ABC-type cobalt transport system substrate-binding protein
MHQSYKELCDDEITVTFDDSIIEDKNSEMLRDLQVVSNRLMKRTEFRKKYFGENDDEAATSIKEIDAEQPQAVDIFSMT